MLRQQEELTGCEYRNYFLCIKDVQSYQDEPKE